MNEEAVRLALLVAERTRERDEARAELDALRRQVVAPDPAPDVRDNTQEVP